MMPRSKTYIRYKLYQVPLFLSWLISLTHCAGNGGPSADINQNTASDTSALASNGAYQLVNVKSNLALDLQDGGTQNGTAVVLNTPSNAASQQWTLRAEANATYALINQQSKQVLYLTGGSSAQGTPLETWTDLQDKNQQWEISVQPNSTYQLISAVSGQCLDLTSGATSAGTRAQQWTCASGSDEMLWKIVPADGNSTAVAGNNAPGNANTAVNTNTTTTPTATTPTTSNNSTYTTAQLAADMNNVLQNRTPIYSNRNLGNPANIAMWTPDKIQSLLNGIVTAHEVFYTNISLTDLAHLIIAEGAQESTGNYDLQGWSVGFIQSTPSTVGVNYTTHGTAITSSVGAMLSPTQAINYDDPGQNVVSWAWYTYNVVSAGESMNEVATGNPQGQVTRDFGNAEFDWLAGPHNDRHNASQAPNFQDYHDRIKDYFVQANFGTADHFESLLNTPIGNTLIDEH